MDAPHMTVEAYAGYNIGEETPKAFTLDGMRMAVADVIDRWYTDTHSYFRVRASDSQRYVPCCRYDEGLWELVVQERVVMK